MEVGLSKYCHICETIEIRRKYPDYKFNEPYGNRPIRASMELDLPEKMCVIGDDDFITTVCLDHLGLMLKRSLGEN